MSVPDSPCREWLEKAEEDEFAGVRILEANRFLAPACFHFQQMAEKLLKALLVFHGKEFPKIHDLIALAGLIEPVVPTISHYRAELEILDRYYIETRYPGDYPEFSLVEAQQACDAALKIKKFVLELTGSN